MALHPVKEEALLVWINELGLGEPVQRVSHLQDGNLLLKLVCKLKGEELSEAPVHLPQAEKLSLVSDFLYRVCHVQECILLTLAKGKMLELELTKVVLLLCYYGLVNSSLVPKVEVETELQMATMFRYIEQGASGLSLRDGLDKLLTTSSLIHTPSVSSVSSYSDDGSPVFPRSRPSQLVTFVELDTVASSSFVSSPVQDMMSTPQVQVKRLRKELAREEDVRDELERELAERISLLSDKEGQISQLQHRLQRLQRDQDDMEKEHQTTLTELQQKIDGLLARVHELLKQSRDLKTDNTQKERRIDELTEENGTLAAQVRNTIAQLTRAEDKVSELTEAHNSSQMEWGNKMDLLQRELNQALTEKEYLTEQIQILEGKISVLEDELARLSQQPQEKGEVLGPIVEWEKLKQELEDLTLKHSQLQETIVLLEKEKKDIETLLAEERSSFKKETLHLEGRISDLQRSITNLQAERETQEQASRSRQESLVSKIAGLETDLAHLQQLEIQLTAEIAATTELRRQRGALEAKVTSLEGVVNTLQSKCESMEAENTSQQEVLNSVRADLNNAQISLAEYEKKLADHHKVVEDNACLRARISALDDTVANLQTEIDAERRRGDELLAAKEEQKALMEGRFQKQEQKAHEMFAELETLSQELRSMKHQKLDAESCIEKLTQEGMDLKTSLAQEQDRSQSQLALLNKAKDESEMELQQIITENQSKISELQSKIEGTVESLKQSESELAVLKEKIISKDGELVMQQQELAQLQNKTDNLQKHLFEVEELSRKFSQDVESKEQEVQHLKVELDQKEGEIQSLKSSLLSIEVKSAERHDLHQKELEEQIRVIADLKFQLAEAEKLILQKVKCLEDLTQQLKDLTEELSVERQRVATLENSLKASKEAHELQEETLRLEASQLQQEIDGHLKKMEESLIEISSLRDLLSRQQGLALEKEREVSVLAKQNKSLEESFAQLQNKLAEATTIATERQLKLLKLQEDIQHQENLRAKAQEIEETQRKELQREVTELQAKVQELTSLASEREIQLGSLCEKMKDQEECNQKFLQQSQEALQKELEKVEGLKVELESAKHQTAVKNELLGSTEEKLKQLELLYQQKETLVKETCQAKETLERTVAELCSKQKQDLDRYQQDLETLSKEKEHLCLAKESLQSEYQTLQAEKTGQNEELNALKTELQENKKKYEKDVEILQIEKHQLSSVNQSLQVECTTLHVANKEQKETLISLKAELQSVQDGYRTELETLKKDKEHLGSVNQSLQSECQNLREEGTLQMQEMNALRSDLQQSQDKYEKDLETLKNEKEHHASVIQNLQEERTLQQKEMNALLVDLQESKDKYEKDLETLRNEKVSLTLVNQSLQNECQNLQAVRTGHEEELNTLKSDLQANKDQYHKDIEAQKSEKVHLSSVNQSLQTECQILKLKMKDQQETLNAVKADLQNVQDVHRQEVETLKKEQEHLCSVNQSLQSECRSLQEEKTLQQKEVNALRVDLQESKDKYEKDLEVLRNEKEHLAVVNQSLQSECQNLQELRLGKEEELNALKSNLQANKDQYQKDLEALRSEKEHFSSLNLSLQTECQNVLEEKTVQQRELNALRADLQETKEKYEQDLEASKTEKEHHASVIQSLQSECQNLQEEKTQQQKEVNALRVVLQDSKERYETDLETLKIEKENLAVVNQSLQSECQDLQEEKTVQQRELYALRADLQETKEKYEKDLEALEREKEQLSLAKQDLQAEKMEQQDKLSAFKAELQENKEKFHKDLQTLEDEKNQLASVNQCLLKDLEAAQKVGIELVSVKEGAQQREKELEIQIAELQVKTEKISALANEREAEIGRLHSEIKQQEASRISAEESEKALRAELQTKVAELQVQVKETSKLVSEREAELAVLQDQVKESEKEKQDACQANRVLEMVVSELRLEKKRELEEFRQQLEALAKEKDALTTVNLSLQAQQDTLNDLQSSWQQEVKTLKKEKEHLSSVNQSLQRECEASQRLGTGFEAKVKEQNESIRTMKEAIYKKEKQNQELQEQLRVKTETVEHYKVQVEKAKTHYNGKKQQLLEEQEARQNLQASLDSSESEAKALRAELKLVSMELEKMKSSEKNLSLKVKSLETQLDYADRQLRELQKQGGQGVQARHRESVYVKIPEKPQNESSDSLDLDDSLNGKHSAPGEASTPLVRSSERLAAKRRAQDGGSLETLYFTPMMPRIKARKSTNQDHKLESSITSLGELTLDSARKPSSSVQRRRTTQVINITMTKKTPQGGATAADESFFSLHSAQSQPNLASHRARPVSAEIFDDPNKLLSLPGYRRSNAHGTAPPRASSAFCIGSENEPDHIADDWMRIAELQSRNKACLPHLKSSYPLESRPSLGFSHLPVTDEDVRTGNPDDTIRRASMVPSQIKDSIAAHRLSLAPPAAAVRSHAPSKRAPQVSKAREVRSTRSPLAPKRPAGQVQDLDTPEAKKLVSCFPRTPKGRNLRSASSQNIAPSPADRRQSMAFVIDNTPKKAVRGDSRLQRGINKLRKSPRATSTKSPKITSSAKKSPSFSGLL